MLTKISECKAKYAKTLQEINVEYETIASRSHGNCKLLDDVLKIANEGQVEKLQKSLKKCYVAVSNEKVNALKTAILHLGSVKSCHCHQDVIDEEEQDSDFYHNLGLDFDEYYDVEQFDDRHTFEVEGLDEDDIDQHQQANVYHLIYCDADYSVEDCIDSWLDDDYDTLTKEKKSTLRCYLGSIYYRRDGAYFFAKIEFEEAIELDNNNALAYYEYATMLYELGDYKYAARYYRIACYLYKFSYQQYTIDEQISDEEYDDNDESASDSIRCEFDSD